MKVIVVALVIADAVTFIEAELELLEEATLPAEEEGLALTGRIEAGAATAAY